MTELLFSFFSFSRIKKNFLNFNISVLSFFDNTTSISNKSRIERFVILRKSSVDDYTYIGHGSNFLCSSVGKFCSISRNVNCGLSSHPTDFISTSPIFFSESNGTGTRWVKGEALYNEDPEPIRIGNDVWIGMHATITGGVSIGNGAVIGAHSVVTKSVPPYAIVAGIPARIIRYRFEPDIIEKLESLQWWNLPEDVLKRNIHKFQSPIRSVKDLELE